MNPNGGTARRPPVREKPEAIVLPRWLGTTLPPDHLLDPGDELIALREGLIGNVAAVRHEGTLSLEIDRKSLVR